MWHWNRIDDQGVATEPLDLEAEALEEFAIYFECFGLGGTEVKSKRQKQTLRGHRTTFQSVHELLVKHSLMGGMLIDEHETLFVLKGYVGVPQLNERWYGRGGRRHNRPVGFGEISRRFSLSQIRRLEQRGITIHSRLQYFGADTARSRWGMKTERRSEAEGCSAVEVSQCPPYRRLDRAL